MNHTKLPFCANNFPVEFLHAFSSAHCDRFCLFVPGMFWKLVCGKCFLCFISFTLDGIVCIFKLGDQFHVWAKESALFSHLCLTRDRWVFLVKREHCSFLQFCFWLTTSEKHVKSLKKAISLHTADEVYWWVLCDDLWSKGWTHCCLMCLWASTPEWGRLAFMRCWQDTLSRERMQESYFFPLPLLFSPTLYKIPAGRNLHLRCVGSDFCSELGGEKRFRFWI